MPQYACPMQCIYCRQDKITGSQGFDLPAQLPQIKAFVRFHAHQSKQIAFYGGSFTLLPLSVREQIVSTILPLMDSETSLRISTRPDAINPEILSWCHTARIQTIELGVQDFSDDVLIASKRGYTSRLAMKSANMILESGIELGIQLMPGLPGYTQGTNLINHHAISSLKPHYLRLYPTVVIKDTALEAMYLNGEYLPLELSKAIDICADWFELIDPLPTRIIKVGLPSTLKTDDLVAGPYHPAFGEFVKTELLVRRLERTYKASCPVKLNKDEYYMLKGQRQRGLKILEERLDSCKLEISDFYSQDSCEHKKKTLIQSPLKVRFFPDTGKA